MNNDLISRKALISRIENEYKQWGEDYDAQQILSDIEDMPAVNNPSGILEEQRKIILCWPGTNTQSKIAKKNALAAVDRCIKALNSKDEIHWLKWENGEEWGKIECPMLGGEVMTYYPKGAPAYYSYTAPFVDDDGDICYYRFDHDEGCWDDTLKCIGEYADNAKSRFEAY